MGSRSHNNTNHCLNKSERQKITTCHVQLQIHYLSRTRYNYNYYNCSENQTQESTCKTVQRKDTGNNFPLEIKCPLPAFDNPHQILSTQRVDRHEHRFALELLAPINARFYVFCIEFAFRCQKRSDSVEAQQFR